MVLHAEKGGLGVLLKFQIWEAHYKIPDVQNQNQYLSTGRGLNVAENKHKINVVYSWKMDRFNLSPATLETIKRNLFNLRFQMPTEPSPYEKQLDMIHSGIYKKQEEKGVPWFFILSDDPKFLNACSTDLPVSFALSTAYSVYATSVDDMMRLFHQKPPTDDFSPDPRGDTIREIRTAGLLVLNGITEMAPGANKYAGRFTELFLHRTKYDLPTVFTMFYDTVYTKKTWDKIKEQIAVNIGATSAGIINRYIDIFHFKQEVKPPSHFEFGV